MQFYNKEKMKENYEILRNFYGNHTIVADTLGISRDHYRRVRNDRGPMSFCLRKFIFFLAKTINTAQKENQNGKINI